MERILLRWRYLECDRIASFQNCSYVLERLTIKGYDTFGPLTFVNQSLCILQCHGTGFLVKHHMLVRKQGDFLLRYNACHVHLAFIKSYKSLFLLWVITEVELCTQHLDDDVGRVDDKWLGTILLDLKISFTFYIDDTAIHSISLRI